MKPGALYKTVDDDGRFGAIAWRPKHEISDKPDVNKKREDLFIFLYRRGEWHYALFGDGIYCRTLRSSDYSWFEEVVP